MAFEFPAFPLVDAGPVFAVLVSVTLAAPLVARRLRVPDLVVLLVAGTVLGPAGLGVLERDGLVGTLGAAGLLYLMFLAGLELDLDDFAASRGHAVRFGALTFAVPLALGTGVALLLGFPLLASVLLGSCWSSHTLLTYPQFRRAGTAGHRSVAVTVGATIITDTLALVVLVVVSRAFEGALTPVFVATIVPSALLLVAATVLGLPRLARRFFATAGQDPSLRLWFVLACLFGVSTVTQLLGIEPILGAFLAGLALNRSVPNGGALMQRVELLGSALFVPVFLVATGMLVDVRVLSRPVILLTGVAFAVTATVSKLLAAAVAGRWLGLGPTEVGTMFSLSNAQAAATLAAVVVGLEVGLFDESVVNAVLLVILVTCLVASVVANRVAPRLSTGSRRPPLGAVVVAPVVNPTTAAWLLELASAFARGDAGVVVPLVVAPTGSTPATLTERRALLSEVVTLAQSAGAEARPVLRIDTSAADGIGHTVTETDASLLLLGWQGIGRRGRSRLGGVVDAVVESVTVPTLVLHDGGREVRRVVVVVDHDSQGEHGRQPLLLALRAAALVARERRVGLTVVSTVVDRTVLEVVTDAVGDPPAVRTGRREDVVAAVCGEDDLIVLPTLADAGTVRALVARVLRTVPPGASTLIALARGVPSTEDRGRRDDVAGGSVTSPTPSTA